MNSRRSAAASASASPAGHQQAGAVRLDQIEQSTHGARDHRQARSHRFDGAVWKRLGPRGQHEDVGRAEQIRDVLAMAEKDDAALETAGAYQRFELRAARTVADDLELHVGEVGGELRGGGDQRLVVLLGPQVRDGDHPPSRLRRSGGQAREVPFRG